MANLKQGVVYMRIFRGRWIFGLLVILIGVAMLLENLGWMEIDLSFIIGLIFPALLILLGIDILTDRPGFMGSIGGGLLLLIGANMIGRKFGWFHVDLSVLWRVFWPAILILIGISIMTSVRPGSKNNLAIMGGIEKTKATWKLESDTYTAIMGGIDLDLRMAEIPQGETDLKLTAIMGGIDIIVPHDITVKCKGRVILGGLEFLDRSTGGIVSSLEAEQIGDGRVVNIHSSTIMGGIEIESRMAFMREE